MRHLGLSVLLARSLARSRLPNRDMAEYPDLSSSPSYNAQMFHRLQLGGFFQLALRYCLQTSGAEVSQELA